VELPYRLNSLALRRRVVCWCIVALVGFMAVGWRSFGGTSAGTLRYFQVPMVFVLLLAQGRMILLDRIKAPALAYLIFSVTYIAISQYNGVAPFAIDQLVYLSAAFSVAATLMTATEQEWRILRWAGPTAVILFCFFFWIDAQSIGINPIRTIETGITTNNRNLIEFTLFQQVFNARTTGQGIFNSTALRGSVIAGMVVPMLYSAHACTIVGHKGRIFTVAYWVAWFIAGVMVVVSLARALEITVVLSLLLPLGRFLVSSRVRMRTMLTFFLSIAIVAIGVVTPLASLLYARIFDDTGSYDAREGALSLALKSIGESPLLGQNTGGDITSVSAHNFILDPTVFAGVFTGLLAAVFVVLIFRDIFRGIRAYARDPRLLWAVAAALYAPVAMFSSGSGTLLIPECMGLALFYGVMASSDGFIQRLQTRDAALPLLNQAKLTESVVGRSGVPDQKATHSGRIPANE
jgi:hypothetical protein